MSRKRFSLDAVRRMASELRQAGQSASDKSDELKLDVARQRLARVSLEAATDVRLFWQERRQCKALRRDGQRCAAFALWGSEDQLCAAHFYKTRVRGRELTEEDRLRQRRGRRPACRCKAYQWPHRPGNGLCQWPDPPLGRYPVPAGSHAPGRLRPEQKRRLLG